MKTLFLSLLLACSFSAGASASQKNTVLEQLHQACVKNSQDEGKSQEEVCKCVRANYEKKLSPAELEFLQRSQAGKLSKQELEEQADLIDFDQEVADKCVEDPLWRWAPPKKEENAETKALPSAAKGVKNSKPAKR